MNIQSPYLAISKETVAEMPQVCFDGDITVIDTVDKARIALRALTRARMVGFDTETRPSFRRGQTHHVALMQLSTADRCYLFRLNKLGVFDALVSFLENPEVTKIGISIHDDINVLHRSSPIEPHGFIELQNYVKQFGIADMSLQKIYAIVFGGRISKGQRLSNWEADELTVAQQQYAALDAWACLNLYDYLSKGKFHPDECPYHIITQAEDAPAQKQTAT